jgi:DNA (cytosine-5)-methyltransferase 1
MNELALFAGIGGGILGTQLLGHRCVCAVEFDPHAQSVLLARQNEGLLPAFPVWDDVTTFDGRPWKGIVDVVSGGFPCQDISVAGKQKGLTGERSGLWKEMSRIIGEVCPKIAFIENSPQLTRLGLDKVLWDLAEMGFDAEWGCIGAHNANAPHKRERIWVVAYSKQNGFDGTTLTGGIDTTILNATEGEDIPGKSERGSSPCLLAYQPKQRTNVRRCPKWWDAEPELGRVANGIPNRMDRVERLGNAQVPAVARIAFELLMERATIHT